MKILMIGGTGNISSACTAELLNQGNEVIHITRGITPSPFAVETVICDTEKPGELEKAVEGRTFDTVINFIAYHPEEVKRDIRIFRDRTAQYIFISTASAYHKPLLSPHITESTPLHNPWWDYSAGKIECENLLMAAWEKTGFPLTIVRPSHTYSERWIPSSFGSRDYTAAKRILEGKPVAVHGDGQSLWTLTHADDFAAYFSSLPGNTQALGEAFHITSDESLTWDMIHLQLAEALGREVEIVHLPMEYIRRQAPEFYPGLQGDKRWSVLFDNSKIRRFAPGVKPQISFSQGIRRSIAWFEAHPAAKVVDQKKDLLLDKLIKRYRAFLRTSL